MARLRRDLRETRKSDGPGSDVDAEQRFRDLRRVLLASEPDTPAAAISESILAKAKSLEATQKSPAAKLAALEKHIAGLGVLEAADRHAARAERTRQRLRNGERRL